jgi:DNA-binding NtrC family response regulator
MKTTDRLLVVDDDRRMVKTICDILEIKGYEPVPVFSGEEALKSVGSETFSCALMDIRMTGLDGIDTLKIVKKTAPDLPVILMSGYITDEQREEAKRHGAYTVLGKPIDIQMVLSFLSILMKEKSILVVDDDPEFCRTLKDILESRDYRVQTVIDPDRVMTHMEREYKLVVILDLRIGHRNGADTLKIIRERYPTKPVILVTGYGKDMADAINRRTEIGAYTCLYKPLEIDTLVGHIEEIDRLKLRNLLGEKTDV